MKRIILRIAALGVVVVLGLIAIAQAQRGTKDTTMPAKADANPLRADALRSAPAQKPIEKPAGKPAVDPFSKRSSPPPPAQLRPTPPAVLGGGDIPDASRLAAPPQPFPPRDTAATRPIGESSASEPLILASAGEMARPLRGQRDGALAAAATASDVQAPARFREDPRTAPAATAEPGFSSIDDQGSTANPVRHDPPSTGRATAPQGFPTAINPVRGDFPSQGDSALRGNSMPPGFPSSNALARGDFPPSAATPVPLEAAVTREGTGQPGSKLLDGPQVPQLTIEKSAPEQIQVGKLAVFKITVRNTGNASASDVVIYDQTPKGTRLISTTPQASRGPRGEIVWQLGALSPGKQSSVEMRLMPIAEGQIGSTATVQFNASASARSICTKPELVVKTSMAEQVLIGEEVTLTITVSNPGSGTASGVVLEEHIPAGLQHPAGGDLEYEVGDLPPGETRKLELTLIASRAGTATNVLVAHGDANLRTEDRVNIEIVAPKLDVSLSGPKRRYLEREATYRLSVHNPGTAPAKEVELVAYLPSGLKFVSANNTGRYEKANRAVYWRLEELPTGETGTVELVTMPVEAGQQSIRLRGTAQKGLTIEKEQSVVIEGIAAILFQVADVTDPIEVGGEATYEIRVLNQGSKAATNVRLAVLLPPELRPLAAEGPARHAIEGNRVVFDGLARLAPKADTTYRVRAQALRPGDLRTRVQLMTDEMRNPVTKEESTQVFSDE